PRVFVTGIGVVAPVGQNASEFFAGLVAAQSGIRPVAPDSAPGSSHAFVAGKVNFAASKYWAAHQSVQFDRATQFALVAAQQAIDDAALDVSEEESMRAGVYWGTGLGGATTMEESYRNLFAGNG